jgi:glycosyltransferase involved in cell wall biosynthesis
VATVHHGLASAVCPFNAAPRGEYFAFLGRVAPEKGLDRAIAIARRAGVRLRIAAKVDLADERYFHQRIAPLLRHPHIEFVGEVAERDKAEFLGNATALLFPIDWPEPFGLAMIEAMSCGTPVIAWPHGAVPEIVDHGVTGCVVNSIDEAVEAVKHIGRLERSQVRARFEERFTAARMAGDYAAVYESLVGERPIRVIKGEAGAHAAG